MSPQPVDLVVLGSGAGGMSAALAGALLGLEVVLVEKAAVVGGTSALSAGSVWIPNSHHAPPGSDSIEQARRYLRATVGERLRPALCEAFLAAGPSVVRFLEERSAVRLRAYPHHPDYFADAEGATLAGRVLEPLPFDGRRLGRDLALLRPPVPEFTLFGGMMVDRGDIGHLLDATRSLASAQHALRLLGRYALDRLRHPRGTRLVMGNALAGRLLYALLRERVALRTGTAASGLIERHGRIVGVTLSGAEDLLARRGVVLATGGFSRHPELRRRLLPAPVPEHSPLVDTVTGDGVTLGLAAGGRLGEHHAATSFLAPVSIRPRRDGSRAVFPHFVLDRGKPGLIAVDSAGRRFVNEALPYHRFGQAIYAAHALYLKVLVRAGAGNGGRRRRRPPESWNWKVPESALCPYNRRSGETAEEAARECPREGHGRQLGGCRVAAGVEPTQGSREALPSRREELFMFLLLAVLIWPVLAVAVVGGYGFLVWMTQLVFGPPGPPG